MNVNTINTIIISLRILLSVNIYAIIVQIQQGRTVDGQGDFPRKLVTTFWHLEISSIADPTPMLECVSVRWPIDHHHSVLLLLLLDSFCCCCTQIIRTNSITFSRHRPKLESARGAEELLINSSATTTTFYGLLHYSMDIVHCEYELYIDIWWWPLHYYGHLHASDSVGWEGTSQNDTATP